MRYQAIEAEVEVPKAMAQTFRDGNLEIYLNIGRMKMKNLVDKRDAVEVGIITPVSSSPMLYSQPVALLTLL